MTQASIEFNGDKIKKEMEQALAGSKELKEAIDIYSQTTKKSQVLHKAYAKFKEEKAELLQEKERLNAEFGEGGDPVADRSRLEEINRTLETLDESLFSLKKRVDPGVASSIRRDIIEAEERIYMRVGMVLDSVRMRYQKILDQQYDALASNMATFHQALTESTNIDIGDEKLRLRANPTLRLEFSDYSRIGGVSHSELRNAVARARSAV